MTADQSKKKTFLLFLQVYIFGIQISEFLDFRYPDVKTWWYSSFKTAFQKIKKWSF